jgi:hypothetical protein
MKYFAYGSNMLLERLRNRVSSAIVLGIARLSGYTLVWNKKGKDGSGKCSIRISESHNFIWGVLYEIDFGEKPNLDRIEGLGHGYDEIMVELEFNGESLKASTYIGTIFNQSLKPFHWYKDFVIQGAIQSRLPQNYISILQTAGSICDHDKKRQSENNNILKKVLK